MKATAVFRLFVVGLTALLALVPQASSLAVTPVDPGTLIPPPPAAFNPVCWATSSGVMCHVQFSDPPAVDQDAGFSCKAGTATYEVLITPNRAVNGLRWYNQDKKLVEKRYTEDGFGTYKNPLTGAILKYIQNDVVHTLPSVPGDESTGTVTVTGLQQRVFTPKGRTVLIDFGISTYAGDGTFISHVGVHPFDDYFALGKTDALQPICKALS
jgi:hypothetical protein